MSAVTAKASGLFVADLKQRRIDPSWATAANVFAVSNARSELYSDFPPLAATCFPYFEPNGQQMTFTDKGYPYCRIRILEDEPKGYVKSKPRKYRQPRGSTWRVYFPRGSSEIDEWPAMLANPKQYLLLTEGEWKSLVACSYGFPCLGLGGVFGFATRGVFLPDLEAVAWKSRLVFIVFDSDATTNPDIQIAERRLSAELIARGAKVCIVRLPTTEHGGKQGLDDFLVRNGVEALTQLLDSAPVADPGKSLVLEGTDVEIADSVLRDLGDAHRSRPIYCEGEFHVHQGTHWRTIPEHEIRNAIFRYDKERFKNGAAGLVKLNKGRADSIMSIMRDRAAEPGFFAVAPVGINCVSGFIRFEVDGTPELEPHDSDHRQRHCLPGAWAPNATLNGSSLLGKFLRGCFGEDGDYGTRVRLVSEICGVAALGIGTKLSAPKAIVLFGPTAENGKSELLAMVRGLLPSDAVCTVPPTRLGDERMLIKLAGKMLNACDELGTTQAIASDTFKSVVTGNPVMGKELYKPAVSFAPAALNIYATNVLPPFHGGFDRGVQRRLLILPFNRSIPKAEQVAEIGKRVATDEMDNLLAFAVEGAARIVEAGHFSEPPSCRDALREWVFNADPVLAWLANRTEYAEGHRLPTKQAYNDFQEWALTEGLRSDRLPSSPTFVNRLCAQDGRITTGRNSSARYIVGLRLFRVERWPVSDDALHNSTVPAPEATPRPRGSGTVTVTARGTGQNAAEVTQVS